MNDAPTSANVATNRYHYRWRRRWRLGPQTMLGVSHLISAHLRHRPAAVAVGHFARPHISGAGRVSLRFLPLSINFFSHRYYRPSRQQRVESIIITHFDGSRRGSVFSGVCPSVRLSVFMHNILKTAEATITKLDIEMFHYASWKPVYFGVKRSKVKITST